MKLKDTAYEDLEPGDVIKNPENGLAAIVLDVYAPDGDRIFADLDSGEMYYLPAEDFPQIEVFEGVSILVE